MNPDFINGIFQYLGGFFLLNHCRVVLKHKSVKGVSIISSSFFFSWGLWNIYYYQNINQIWSFYAGIFISTVNLLYVVLLIKYRNH